MSRAGKQHTGRKKRTTNQPREVWTTQRRRLRRELGQNFFKHEKTARRLVREAGVTDRDLVVEIGAGSGVLTRPLADEARRVIAIERDPRYASRLERSFAAGENVEVVVADVLSAPLPDETFRVVANVPFHLTTAILHRLLDDPALPSERLHLLVQKEVANKHARTTPTTLKTLTWSPWWRFEVGLEVPASAFEPKPKVDARLLAVERRNPPLIPCEHREPFRAFTRAAFDGRGNTVSKTLRPYLTKRQVRRLAHANGFSTDSFSSQLTVYQWAAVFGFMVRAVPQHRWPRFRTETRACSGWEGRG
jgi:23S rRNA (adenine-N6)-dimethyltransferase